MNAAHLAAVEACGAALSDRLFESSDVLFLTGDLASQLFDGLVFVSEVVHRHVEHRGGQRSLLQSSDLKLQCSRSLVCSQFAHNTSTLIAEIASRRKLRRPNVEGSSKVSVIKSDY